jgi:uncharacterized coiled-coil protein SlyX
MGDAQTNSSPDPTALTTKASERLEKTLRSLTLSEIAHQNDLFTEKVNGVNHAFGEKLARVEARFDMLETRTAEQKKDTKDALDAALAAQKEAVASQTASSEKSITKSETATIERIKAVETLLSASTRASDDKIDDLKARVIAIEAVKLGNTEQTTNTRATSNDMRGSMATVIGVITTIIAIVGIIITIFVATKH